MDDTGERAGEHQPHRYLGINSATAIVEAIAVGDVLFEPREIENSVDACQHMFVRNELPEGACNKQLQLIPLERRSGRGASPPANHQPMRASDTNASTAAVTALGIVASDLIPLRRDLFQFGIADVDGYTP